MARVYLASRYGRRPQMHALARVIEAAGHTVTARWVHGSHDSDEIGDQTCALDDLQDLEAADVLVSFTETDTVPGRARGGRHVEFGYALARGKRCIVIGPRENVFHHVPGVEVIDPDAGPVNVSKLLDALNG
jgi:hypothetical protein